MAILTKIVFIFDDMPCDSNNKIVMLTIQKIIHIGAIGLSSIIYSCYIIQMVWYILVVVASFQLGGTIPSPIFYPLLHLHSQNLCHFPLPAYPTQLTTSSEQHQRYIQIQTNPRAETIAVIETETQK